MVAAVETSSPTAKTADGRHVIWTPQAGSQRLFLNCPIYECLYEGTRGPGKTDALLMAYAQYVGMGFGADWRGIIFRESYPNLEDVIAKSEKWFPRIFPGIKFNASKYYWRWPTGERLYLRHAAKPKDYWKYHGHEYPFVGWEELTNWPDDELYKSMMSVNRSSNPHVPRMYRATCNPYGVGHNWVKARFIDPAPRGTIIREVFKDEQGDRVRERVAVHGTIWENKILLASDPDYILNLKMQGGPRLKAWLFGDWDITAGGMFDDLWDASVHIVEPFEIPNTWRVDRSFDWGSSKPYSVGFWAESDGSDVHYPDGRVRATVKGDLFRLSELYGWTGQPNKGTREVATAVGRKTIGHAKKLGLRVRPGPADVSIYTIENGNSIAGDMASVGCRWERASGSRGGRKNGWELMRRRLFDAINHEGPGLFVFATCAQFIRTVPSIKRDETDMDDVDTETEDHIADESRYRVLASAHEAGVVHVPGLS